MLGILLCYLRVPSQLASPPGLHFNTHPEGEPCAYMCVCLRHFHRKRPHAKRRSTSCCIKITVVITPTLDRARGHGHGHVITLILPRWYYSFNPGNPLQAPLPVRGKITTTEVKIRKARVTLRLFSMMSQVVQLPHFQVRQRSRNIPNLANTSPWFFLQ